MAREAQQAAAKPRRDGRIRVSDLTSPRTIFILCVAVLTALGLIMVMTATTVELAEAGSDPYAEIKGQLLFLAIGLAFCAFLAHISYTTWMGGVWFWLIYLAIMALLVAVLVMGTDSHGATRWLYIGSFSLQPSEFVKIALVIFGARLMSEEYRRGQAPGMILVKGVLLLALPMGLVLVQKDLGTLVIISVTLFCMLALTGVKKRWLFTIVGLLIAGVLLLIVSASYRSDRFVVWLTDPFLNTSWYYDQGWQPAHSLLAFGSGGFFGVGIGNSRQKYSYLPEAENDYIFAILGEELGFIGTFAVVVLFCLLGWAGYRIAQRSSSVMGKLMAAGLTTCILVQTLVNMCGVLGILPMTGRPLPFMSSGGSSVVSTFAMVGLILSVDRVTRREEQAGPRRNLRVIAGGRAPVPGEVAQLARAVPAQGQPDEDGREGWARVEERRAGDSRGRVRGGAPSERRTR